MAVVKSVYKHSPFFKELKTGDVLVSVNGNKIRDVLDYMFYCSAKSISITVNRNGKQLTFSHRTDFSDPGIEFDTYLMDKQRHCANKCIFCFIDQLPKNMRSTMYFKDDDFRLALLFGNYVTLTNVSQEDIKRIIDLKISPLNVSVHTTDPDLRVRMLSNPNAGNIYSLMKTFADAGINMRAQIVLCKGFNDGENLTSTMTDLKALYPAVSSVSVVPFGCTAHRDGLCKIDLFTPQESSAVIDQINRFGDTCLAEFGTRLIYPADEFYVKAGRDVPGEEFYEEFEQIENGVGMLSSFIAEFLDAVDNLATNPKPKKVSIVTGMIMKSVLPELFGHLQKKLTGLEYDLHFIRNDFFGPDITVTGLITGADIISQLKGTRYYETLVIPDVMLRDDKFLDDVSVSDIEKELGVKVETIRCSGADTVTAFSDIIAG